jgi:hypothetical protein
MFENLKYNLGIASLGTLICLVVEASDFYSGSRLSAQIIGVEEVKGTSGGGVDSKDCGYIANQPNHVLNLMERTDYLRVSLQVNGGEPTLLIIGPGAKDRFCVLGDRTSAMSPELSGVWEAGKYLIYVGDRTGSQLPFTLNISLKKLR